MEIFRKKLPLKDLRKVVFWLILPVHTPIPPPPSWSWVLYPLPQCLPAFLLPLYQSLTLLLGLLSFVKFFVIITTYMDSPLLQTSIIYFLFFYSYLFWVYKSCTMNSTYLKYTKLMRFSICVLLWNHHHSQENEHTHCLQVSLCPLEIPSFFVSRPASKQPLICFLSQK